MRGSLLFFFFSLTLYAQDGSFSSLKNIKIDLHDENFVMPFSYMSPLGHEARNDVEVRYQLGGKVILGTGEHTGLHLAYVQKSFFQIYSVETSRPIRETNYHPHFFYRFGGENAFFDLGWEHESNGETDPRSRSWDRIFIKFHLVFKRFKINAKYWSITNEETHGPDFEERRDPMKRFMGRADLTMAFFLGKYLIKSYFRYNPSTSYGFLDTKIMYPVAKHLYFFINYSKGYGVNLRDYNRNIETSGFGFLVNP